MRNQLTRLQTRSVNLARKALYGAYGLPTEIAPNSDSQTCFVMGHMRSGSTLLMRLLSTSPEVLENGELMLSYRNRWDLSTMKGRILWSTRQLLPDPNGVIFVDKLLHNYELPRDNLDLLMAHDIKVVFIVREPEPSISSIAANFHNYSVEEAAVYYVERLEQLSEYARILGAARQPVGLEYGQILAHTASAFALLEEYLGLDSQLLTEYDAPADGYGRGDSSKNLTAGRILSEGEKQTPTEQVPPHLLEQAGRAYEQYRSVVASNCQTIEV